MTWRHAIFCALVPLSAASAQQPVRVMIPYGDLLKQVVAPADQHISSTLAPSRFSSASCACRPGSGNRVPLIVFIHGGCWLAAYNLDHTRGAAAALVHEGYAVWSPEYRRSGDVGGGWPGTFDDVGHAVDFVRTLAARFPRIDTSRVIVMGHSAGGQLALWSATRKEPERVQARRRGEPRRHHRHGRLRCGQWKLQCGRHADDGRNVGRASRAVRGGGSDTARADSARPRTCTARPIRRARQSSTLSSAIALAVVRSRGGAAQGALRPGSTRRRRQPTPWHRVPPGRSAPHGAPPRAPHDHQQRDRARQRCCSVRGARSDRFSCTMRTEQHLVERDRAAGGRVLEGAPCGALRPGGHHAWYPRHRQGQVRSAPARHT